MRRLRQLGKLEVKRLESRLRVASGLFAGLVAAGLMGELREASETSAPILFLAMVALGVVGEFMMLAVEWPVSRRLDDLERKEDAAHEVEMARLATELADANARVAEAHLETERIRARLAPRIIGDERAERIAARLSALGATDVGILICSADVETRRFATELQITLMMAGWGVASAIRTSLPAVSGLFVEAEKNASDDDVRRAHELIEALHSEGFGIQGALFEPSGGTLAGEGKDRASAAPIKINVGEKPDAA